MTSQRQSTTEYGLFYRGTLRGRATDWRRITSIVIVGDVEDRRNSSYVQGQRYGDLGRSCGISHRRRRRQAQNAMDRRTPYGAKELLRIGEIEVKPVIGGSYSWAKLL